MRRGSLILALLLAAPQARAWFAVLPGAVEGLGQAPAVFSSTVYLSNAGGSPATVTFELIPYPGRETPPPATRTIPAGGSIVVERALKSLFGLTAEAGALRVASDQPLAGSLVTANVANPDSTYGVALSPVTERSLLLAGEVGHAPWVSQGGGFRTNVAAVLVDPDTSVTVSVYDASGTLAGRRVFSSISPASVQVPVTDLVGARDLAVGRVEYLVTQGRATGYVAVNDDVTGDAIAVQAPRQIYADQLLDGVAKTGGANGTFWRTDARVLNPNDLPISVAIEPLGLPSASTLPLSVGPRSVVDLPDVLSRFGVEPPAAGALRFRSADAFLVFGRTQNVDPTGQRPGTFAASQAPVAVPAQLLSGGQTGIIGGVEQSPRFRSNLALQATESGASGSLVLRGGAGEVVAAAPFALQPNEWTQKGISDWFPGVGVPAAARVDVSVAAGRLDGYLSRIDNSTGDPVVLGTAAPVAATSDVALTSFTQSPDPMVSGTGGTLVVTLRNAGPEATEGPPEVTVATTVTQGASKLVVQRLTGAEASDWTLVSGTFGVSQTVRLKRKSFLPARATAQVQLAVGVPGGGSVGGPFPGNVASVSVKGDPDTTNNSRTLTIQMVP